MERCVAARLAQSGEHSLCKRGAPGSSPGLAAHFSPSGDNQEAGYEGRDLIQLCWFQSHLCAEVGI
ncbi:hypothetical protein DPMN_060306 [Dreissena polymorpha]|uniref:Uncharacterized protein n=1 Tax=Dreissena polymorpha TaxID=45954 RepID=A0A9D4HI23_DREPO|nr:hypothetical protein DPMN_060306 [Dreissena polymorpha]